MPKPTKTLSDTELLLLAITTWGEDSQLDMVTEECCELVHAVHKYRRGKDTLAHVVEEAVDVSLCAEQIKALEPVLFEKIRLEKLDRLRILLDKEQARP